MAGGTLNYRIELDAAEAQAALQGLQRAGSDLFRTLEQASASVTRGGGFAAFATTIGAAAAAVAGLTGALFQMAKAASETVDELGELASQVGSSVEEISTLRSALVQLEANGETLQRAFLRMGNTIEDMWPGIQKSISGAAHQVENDLREVEQATLNLAKAQLEAANSSDIAAQQQINNSQNIANAIQSEADAQIALDQAKGKYVSAETLRQNTIKRAELALQAAQERRAEAEAKAAREQEEHALRRQQLISSVHEKELKLAEAREKQRQNELNSIVNITARIDAIAEGTTKSLDGINASTENMIKGLIASVGPGVTALEGLGDSFGAIERRAPAMTPVLLKLADLFKNLEDGTLKLSIATKLFGRKDAVDMVEALSKGSAEILSQQGRMRSLGLEITETDKIITEKFIGSLNRLKEAISIVATQLGLLFQPAFAEAMERIAVAVENSRGKILEWGASIRDTVVPILETFVRVLLGIPEAGKDDWLVSYINNIEAFGLAVTSLIKNVIIPAFTALLVITGGVARGINEVFGTELNAFDILLGAWVAKILGAFRLIPIAAGFAAQGIAIAFAATGPVGIVLAAIVAALVLIIKYWPEISAAAEQSAEQILAAWETVKQFVQDWVITPVADAWQWLVDTFNFVVGEVQAAAEAAAQFINDWVVTPVADAWQWLVDSFDAIVNYLKQKWQELKETFGFASGGVVGGGGGGGGGGGFAHGGMVRGRGSGTSDSNLAWVSRGEHIMPARAVRQPGVLAFLEALRRSGGNLARVLEGMNRFALGGMVPSMPVFAGGGLNGMSNVTIQFPGLPAIGGLRASSDVVDELRKAAALAQVRSGGRKPSRYS